MPSSLLLVKLMVICWASGTLEVMDGKIRMVLTGKHPVGHQVENLSHFGGVVLADSKDDGFANLAADGIAEGVFKERLAEKFVGGFGKKPFSYSFCL